MRTVGIREFRNSLKECLDDLPVAVAHHGQTVAIVVSSDFFDDLLKKLEPKGE